MPKMFLWAPEGTFQPEARAQVAMELSELALRCEKLGNTPFIRSNAWVYFNEPPADAVFSGGRVATARLISLTLYAFAGALDGESKRELIAEATRILGRHSGATGRIPVFIVIHEVPEENWGIFGQNGSLEKLRHSPDDAEPI